MRSFQEQGLGTSWVRKPRDQTENEVREQVGLRSPSREWSQRASQIEKLGRSNREQSQKINQSEQQNCLGSSWALLHGHFLLQLRSLYGGSGADPNQLVGHVWRARPWSRLHTSLASSEWLVLRRQPGWAAMLIRLRPRPKCYYKLQ